jgi:DNA-binding transcriptional MerR regulator
MKPADLANILQQAASTIRTWSREFGEYLSPTAQGGEGHHRAYTDHDLRVLAHVKTLKQEGQTVETIRATLEALRADDWRDLPVAPGDAPLRVTAPVAMVPQQAAAAALDEQRRALLREIATLEDRVKDLAQQLSHEQAARRDDVERLVREQTDLRAKLAEAEQLNRLYESGRLKPSGG